MNIEQGSCCTSQTSAVIGGKMLKNRAPDGAFAGMLMQGSHQLRVSILQDDDLSIQLGNRFFLLVVEGEKFGDVFLQFAPIHAGGVMAHHSVSLIRD
jgi:hypothetical protein